VKEKGNLGDQEAESAIDAWDFIEMLWDALASTNTDQVLQYYSTADSSVIEQKKSPYVHDSLQ
jgi:hypothetical protein